MLSDTAWAGGHICLALSADTSHYFCRRLTDKTLDCFERDIAERKRTGFDFGDSCDYETWDAFYKAVYMEIERRKKNVFV